MSQAEARDLLGGGFTGSIARSNYPFAQLVSFSGLAGVIAQRRAPRQAVSLDSLVAVSHVSLVARKQVNKGGHDTKAVASVGMRDLYVVGSPFVCVVGLRVLLRERERVARGL